MSLQQPYNDSDDDINNILDKTVNLFDYFNIRSNQNNRYLITGNSGGGKTTQAFDLIFNVLPKYKRHIYIFGGKDKFKEMVLPEIREMGVDVHDLYLDDSKMLDDIIFENLGKGDLLVVDDLSHLMANHDSYIVNFLNKCYTCSRQQGFDIITIVHKFK